MSTFHLRPVADNSPSPSSSASATPSGDHSPQFKGPPVLLPSPPPSSSSNGRSRRPLSPSSLRDVDLPNASEVAPRKYPTPPTGHELMAMFPPAPPDNFPEMRSGPTSGYFQRQERAFFAQAGKEIVRFRVEVELPQGGDADSGKARAREPGSVRTWPSSGQAQPSTATQHHSPAQSPAAVLIYPHSNSRPSQRGPVPVTPAPLFPMTPHAQPSQPPPNLHPPALHQGLGMPTPGQDPAHPGAPSAKSEFQSDDYRDDPDEAWRRPMPYAERRRAGKHTRRVIVRN